MRDNKKCYVSFRSQVIFPFWELKSQSFTGLKTITQSFAVKCLSYAENVQMERITIVHNGFSGRPTSFRYNSSNIQMQLFYKARFGWSYSWNGCDFVNSFRRWALNCTFWRTHTLEWQCTNAHSNAVEEISEKITMQNGAGWLVDDGVGKCRNSLFSFCERIVPTKFAQSVEIFVGKFTQTIFEILLLFSAFFFEHLWCHIF